MERIYDFSMKLYFRVFGVRWLLGLLCYCVLFIGRETIIMITSMFGIAAWMFHGFLVILSILVILLPFFIIAHIFSFRESKISIKDSDIMYIRRWNTKKRQRVYHHRIWHVYHVQSVKDFRVNLSNLTIWGDILEETKPGNLTIMGDILKETMFYKPYDKPDLSRLRSKVSIPRVFAGIEEIERFLTTRR